jgi:uncharacterized protein (TIGR00730 family)
MGSRYRWLVSPSYGDAMPGGRRICVYCSSSNNVDPVHLDAARELGTALGQRGDTLVWGGATVGCMGELARAVRAAGGRTEGVIPEGLVAREIADDESDELVITADMGGRKAEMAARADAFVALPGGFGTLEELLEQLTLRLLGMHHKPVLIVDVAGFWQPLLQLFDHLTAERFARPESTSAYLVVPTVAAAVDALDHAFDLMPGAVSLPSTWLT